MDNGELASEPVVESCEGGLVSYPEIPEKMDVRRNTEIQRTLIFRQDLNSGDNKKARVGSVRDAD